MGGLFGGNSTISNSEQALGALRVQTSAYGYAVPIVHGKTRITANLIWYGDFVAIPHTTTQSSGGGGGKGGGGTSYSNTTYTYQTGAAMALCEGPISSIGTVWASKEQTTLAALGLTLFSGSYPQSAWGYLSTYHPTQALSYQGTAYVANGAYQLGSSDSLPNHSFEIDSGMGFSGSIRDANPKDSCVAFLTNANYGACPVGFPLGDLTQWSNYCIANGIFISPAIQEQKSASEYLRDYAEITNSALVHSEGVLKIIPYGDAVVAGNGVTFTPAITPVYDLTDDDYLELPTVRRKTPADAFNRVQIEFLNRANQYNPEPAEAKDQANIEQYGLLPAPVIKAHWICDGAIAQKVAQLKLQRVLYIRNEYEIKVGWKYCLLEPMDVVTITDPLGLSLFQVRVIAIEEDESGKLDMTFEEFPFGVAQQATYSFQQAGGYNVNYNAPAPSINGHVIFEAPIELCGNALEAWVGVSSSDPIWGGCDVHVSSDNVTYKRLGSIFGGARMGLTSTSLAAGLDPDSVNTLGVDLTSSKGTLLGGTQDDADSYTTLCYVDGELISYRYATQTAANKYDLTYLRRGAYNTKNKAHTSGKKFARLDEALLKYGYSKDQIGKVLYFKFPSFNIFGVGKESLASVTAVSYTLVGPPRIPDVKSFLATRVDGIIRLTWGEVRASGARSFELRSGLTWEASTFVKLVSSLSIDFDGLISGTLLIKALDHVSDQYSENAAMLSIPDLAKENVMVIKNESGLASLQMNHGIAGFADTGFLTAPINNYDPAAKTIEFWYKPNLSAVATSVPAIPPPSFLPVDNGGSVLNLEYDGHWRMYSRANLGAAKVTWSFIMTGNAGQDFKVPIVLINPATVSQLNKIPLSGNVTISVLDGAGVLQTSTTVAAPTTGTSFNVTGTFAADAADGALVTLSFDTEPGVAYEAVQATASSILVGTEVPADPTGTALGYVGFWQNCDGDAYANYNAVGIGYGAGTLSLVVNQASGVYQECTITGIDNTMLALDKWSFITASYSSAGMRLSIQQEGGTRYNATSGAITAPAANPTSWQKIGNGLFGNNCMGKLDEVRVYNRVITSTEIDEHFAFTFNSDADLVAHWPLSEGTGTVTADLSGSQNMATLNQTALYNPVWSTEGAPGAAWHGTKTNLVADGSYLKTNAATGSYEVDAVDLGDILPCIVDVRADIAQVGAGATTIASTCYIAQKNFAADSYGPWQEFVPGAYSLRYFKIKFVLSNSDTVNNYAQIRAISIAADVPDRVVHFEDVIISEADKTTGVTLKISPAFVGARVCVVGMQSAATGDTYRATLTTSSVNIKLFTSAGVAKAGVVDLGAFGYGEKLT